VAYHGGRCPEAQTAAAATAAVAAATVVVVVVVVVVVCLPRFSGEFSPTENRTGTFQAIDSVINRGDPLSAIVRRYLYVIIKHRSVRNGERASERDRERPCKSATERAREKIKKGTISIFS